MAEKAPETHQCRYFKVSLLEGSFAEMCKERGDFGWKSYEETQRIGAGFAEMCNERGGALRKSLRDGSCVFGENYWYCGEKSVSLRAEQITYHKTMNQTILKRYIAIFLFIATAAVNGWAATLTNRSFTSPNGCIIWNTITTGDSITAFDISYRQDKNSKTHHVTTITEFGVETKDGAGHHLRLVDTSNPHPVFETYAMIVGKKSICTNHGREVVYTFEDDVKRQQRLVVRLYNDGVALRYEMDNLLHTRVTTEHTTFRIDEGTKRWMQKWNEPYEDFYPLATTGNDNNHRWAFPALVEAAPKTWMLLTEAGIGGGHSAASLYNDKQATDYRVVADEQRQNTSGRWVSPWRLALIGGLEDIVASTLVTDVSAPCRLKDTAWIQPGGVSWIYWAHNHGSRDFKIVCQYIDMAVALGLPYVLIDAEWDEMGNGGTIDDALDYAQKQGVKVLIWYNSSTAWLGKDGAPGPHFRLNAPERREREFAWLEQQGVAGVKIDFFAGDKQETMQYCIDLLEAAARHHLMVNFHGATLPRGWQRTYPNLLSTEAVYGAEWYNNSPVLTDKAAAHNATLPFTRGIVGSMDYTPCTFSDSQHPHITTHAHELALAVLFESGLLHWADRPESYLTQPKQVKQLIGSLPTTWDETRLLAGYPGEQVVMARRKGRDWYVAGINGTNERVTLEFNIDFIGSKKTTTTVFTDSGNASSPWHINSKRKGRIVCEPRGGFVMVIKSK